ncbi:MAG TPA: DNA polymerase ligase N-terminal domain-containing protein [Candidatus Bathyarchaeia archaeon]|nr:DNA polymerase ligase N-terminal domain-containing protein [Candidatus Bathyarchaeia archaeon]
MKKLGVGIVVLAIFCGGMVVMVTKKKTLARYKERRDFEKTPEPTGSKTVFKQGKKHLFVIQQHDASHMHFDFRLEIGRILVSWAIPKGPSTNPSVKRLAIMTEDHPRDYAHFEGVIPEGNYGAGTVMVWDIGTYENIKHHEGKLIPMKECLKKGHVEVFLHGKKLQGGYTLVKLQGRENQWLFIKMKDECADARANPVKSQNKSALSGKTLKELSKK